MSLPVIVEAIVQRVLQIEKGSYMPSSRSLLSAYVFVVDRSHYSCLVIRSRKRVIGSCGDIMHNEGSSKVHWVGSSLTRFALLTFV